MPWSLESDRHCRWVSMGFPWHWKSDVSHGKYLVIHPRRVRKSLRVPLQHLDLASARQKQANVGCFNQIAPSLLLPNIDKNKKTECERAAISQVWRLCSEGAQVLQTGSQAGLLSDVPLSRQHSGVLLSSHSANSRDSHPQGGIKNERQCKKSKTFRPALYVAFLLYFKRHPICRSAAQTHVCYFYKSRKDSSSHMNITHYFKYRESHCEHGDSLPPTGLGDSWAQGRGG